jgi:sugar-specific transcriptional regulator TrmB
VNELGEATVKDVLRSLKLTEKEAEVYLFLSKHGILKCSEISKALKRHKSQIYRILKILQNKGLLQVTLESPSRFSAVPLETILDLSITSKIDEAKHFENARKEILAYWSQINPQKLEVPIEKFSVIEGNNKIYSRLIQMVKETKRQLTIALTKTCFFQAEQFGIFDAIATQSQNLTVQFNFVTDDSSQEWDPAKYFNGFFNNLQFKHLIYNSKFRPMPRMVIRDNEEILFFITSCAEDSSVSQEEVCLWTDCKELVQAFSIMCEDF